MPKLSLIFSDIEAGTGNATDDFVEDELLCETIRKHFAESKKYSADLVLNGDIFDFMKAPYKGKYPRHITEKVSIGKLRDIAKAHPLLFKMFKDWLKVSKTNRIIFIYGNHDYDLVFPGVKEELNKIIAGTSKVLKERIIYPGFDFTDNLLHVEHGSQLDRFFKVDPEKLIHTKPSKYIDSPFLLLPWGYNALYDHFIHIKEQHPILERLVPRVATIEAIPWGLRYKLYIESFTYMMKGFFYTQFKYWSDRLYRFHPRVFFAYMLTFMKQEFELKITHGARRQLRKGVYKILSVGHNHTGSIKKVGRSNWILNTGNWRDEYRFLPGRRRFVPKKKSYGYVLHTPKKILSMALIEVESAQKPITMKQLKAILRGQLDMPNLERK